MEVQPHGQRRFRRDELRRRRRLGCAEKLRQAAVADRPAPRRGPRHAEGEPARRLRLPRLRLGRSRARLLLRILRERGEGRGLGGDAEARHAEVLRRPQRCRIAQLVGPRPGASGPADASDGLRRRDRPLPRDQLGRGIRRHRRGAERAGPSRPGRILHLGPRQQRGGLPLPAVRPALRHQQLPGLLEHVPRSLGRGADRGDRHRQGHGAAGGFRRGRCDLRHRPEPRHQPSADAGRPAPRHRPRRHGGGVQPAEGEGSPSRRPRAVPR